MLRPTNVNRNPCLGNKIKGNIKCSKSGNEPCRNGYKKVQKTHHSGEFTRKTKIQIKFENN